LRTSPGLVDPEVHFRFILVVGDGRHGARAAAYREQTFKIVLPKRPARNGDAGVIVQMVSAEIETSPVPWHEHGSRERDRGGGRRRTDTISTLVDVN
jgi:hypothetical protein